MKVQLLCVFLCIFCMHIDQIRANRFVKLYTGVYYGGTSYKIDVVSGTCINMQPADPGISSIDLRGNCVMLFEGQNCSEDFRIIQEGRDGCLNLKEIDFDDRIRSLRFC